MLFSFYILAFNHENFIAAAIDGALAQTYTPLEIIISDDCSTDNTWKIICDKTNAYCGPHKIIARRNQKNIGISAHINEVWSCCSAEWVVASAGDDVSEPDRVAKIAEAVRENPRVKLIQTFLNEIDEDGCLLEINRLGVKRKANEKLIFGLKERVDGLPYMPHGAAMAYSKEICKIFGPLPAGIIFEDNILNVRAELIGKAMVLPEPLVNHRNHAGQITRINSRDDASTRRHSIKRRLDSDVLTAEQNIADFRALDDRPQNLPQASADSYFKERLNYFKNKRNALLLRWPIRLLYLAKITWLGEQVAPFSRSDFLYSLLPESIHIFIVKVRNFSAFNRPY